MSRDFIIELPESQMLVNHGIERIGLTRSASPAEAVSNYVMRHLNHGRDGVDRYTGEWICSRLNTIAGREGMAKFAIDVTYDILDKTNGETKALEIAMQISHELAARRGGKAEDKYGEAVRLMKRVKHPYSIFYK